MKKRLMILGGVFSVIGVVFTLAALSNRAFAQTAKYTLTASQEKEDDEKGEKGEKAETYRAPTNPAGKIAPWTAMKAAQKKVGGRAFQALFEFEDGKWMYGVLVVKNHKITEVDVDAVTGKVGGTEAITPEDEAKEVTEQLQNAIKG